METIIAISKILLLIIGLPMVHYFGYRWARRNPDKMWIEIFFTIEKQESKEPAKSTTL